MAFNKRPFELVAVRRVVQVGPGVH